MMDEMDVRARAVMHEIGLTDADFEAMQTAWREITTDAHFAALEPQQLLFTKSGFYAGYSAGRAH